MFKYGAGACLIVAADDEGEVGETVPGQTSATLELNISTVKSATLLSVSSPVATEIEIHRVVPYKRKMVARVPARDKQVVVLPDADHCAHVEDTHEAWIDAIVQFINRREPLPGSRLH